MKRQNLFYLGLAVLMGAQQISLAAVNQSETTLEKKKFGASVMLQSNTTVQQSGPNKSAATALWFVPTYQFAPDWTASAILSVSQSHTGEEKTELSNGVLAATYTGWKVSPAFHITPQGRVQLPLNEDARVNSFQTALEGRLRGTISFDPLGVKGLSAYAEPGFTRFFHEFSTRINGQSNNRTRFRNALNARYAFNDQWDIQSLYISYSNWTYKGSQVSSFSLIQELGYRANSAWRVALGHENSAGTLEANGSDSNVDFFDENSSQIYGNVTYTF